MRELRQDPTTGRWVALSTERIARPMGRHVVVADPVPRAACPFCPGNESATPGTLDQILVDGHWVARAFANQYPAFGIEGDTTRAGGAVRPRMDAVGAHEVLVEAPDHDRPLWQYPPTQLGFGLELARRRMADLREDRRFRALTWFRNHLPGAGATQPHPHAQIVATPLVPPVHAALAAAAGDPFEDELTSARLLWEDEHVVALCPWAPMAAYEVWLVPRRDLRSFPDAGPPVVDALARGMHAVLKALAVSVEDPPYNAVLYTSLWPDSEGLRWHMRIVPRIDGLAGFELGAGIQLHAVPPEEAVMTLRAALHG